MILTCSVMVTVNCWFIPSLSELYGIWNMCFLTFIWNNCMSRAGLCRPNLLNHVSTWKVVKLKTRPLWQIPWALAPSGVMMTRVKQQKIKRDMNAYIRPSFKTKPSFVIFCVEYFVWLLYRKWFTSSQKLSFEVELMSKGIRLNNSTVYIFYILIFTKYEKSLPAR